mmetsp:Transcript_12270/g.27852  ORF Transcript_12270/g.27852 Transcript_12270/m.27852 type:complete len:714 (+) Transcript_12270:121-2262(+)
MFGRTFNGPSFTRPNSSLSTFMVQEAADLEPAFNEHVPEPIRSELCGVILLSHSFSTEDVRAFAASLPCRCYHAVTCGTIGWDASLGFSHEVEQEGRGKELGSKGVRVGGTAITVIAVRKVPDKRERRARVVLSSGSAPTVADGAIGHVVMGSMRGQKPLDAFLSSQKHAVCAGGLTLNIVELVNHKWVQVDYLVLTFLDPFYTDSCLFNVCVVEILDETPLCSGKGMDMIRSLPSGYRPEFIGQFQCALRGQAMYPKQNVESEGLEKLLGQRAPVCGFVTLTEFGNDTAMRNPDGWNARQLNSTRFYGGAVVLCCFAVVDAEPWVVEHTIQTPYARMPQREVSATPAGNPWFPWLCCTCENRGERVAYESVQPSTYKSVNASDEEQIIGYGTESQKVLGTRSNGAMFNTSRHVKEVDVFISQVIMPMQGYSPGQYGLGKAMDVHLATSKLAMKLSRHASNPKKTATELLEKMTFRVDRACVDQDDDNKEMRIIKPHSEDFLVDAQFFLCMITPHYFTRLWCIFEFCCAFAYRHDFDMILLGGFSSSFLLSHAQAIAASIVNLSVADAGCFDPRDRDIIEEKIRANFLSLEHFEAFTKTAALAMIVRDALPIIVEYNIEDVWQVWMDAVRACEFHDLEAAMSIFDIQKAHERLHGQVPDPPSSTRIFDRIHLCSTHYVDTWFLEELAPLIRTKRGRCLRTTSEGTISRAKLAP